MSIPAAVWRTMPEPLQQDAAVRIVTDKSPEALALYRHSTAHLLAAAVTNLFPGTQCGIGPAIDEGFYYDFILSAPLTEEDFPEIEQRMRKILKKGQRFDCEVLPQEAALARLAEMKEPYKREYALELIDKKHLDGLSFYRNGPFLDMCEGPHVATTKDIPPFIIQQGIDTVAGINVVGMRRAGLSFAQIDAVREAFRVLFRANMVLPAALAPVLSISISKIL